MFVPHTNDGAVLIWNGVVFVRVPLTGKLAYVEKGWVIVTPGLVVESVALTPLTTPANLFMSGMLRRLHSPGSMSRLPLPVLTLGSAASLRTVFVTTRTTSFRKMSE